MKSIRCILLSLSLFSLFSCEFLSKDTSVKNQKDEVEKLKKSLSSKANDYALVIHGGAGFIKKEFTSDSLEDAYRAKLSEALEHGYALLEKGIDAEQVVVETIHILEDSPLFNAGRGAVATADARFELDASIMNGSDLSAGAVAGVTTVKSPIALAQKIKNESPHVFLSGKGAEVFAELQGLEIVENEYFSTEKALNSLEKAKAKENDALAYLIDPILKNAKYGTVGCVVLDKNGTIVAGTSTGGMTNKKYGRIGDVPVIGAGNYANNATCGISATGHGEFFIRNVVAYDISAMMAYADFTLEQAAQIVVHEKLQNMQGSGGVIGIDAEGNVVMEFNSEGMFRGYKTSSGETYVGLFKED